MLEGKSIDLVIFTLLNALGVVFLFYVLANFWKEGRDSKGATRSRKELAAHGDNPRVVMVTVPLAADERREDGRVIRFPIRGLGGQRHVDETAKHAIR